MAERDVIGGDSSLSAADRNFQMEQSDARFRMFLGKDASDDAIGLAGADQQGGNNWVDDYLEDLYAVKDLACEHPLATAGIAAGAVATVALLSKVRIVRRALPFMDDLARGSVGDAAFVGSKMSAAERGILSVELAAKKALPDGAARALPIVERSMANGGLLRDVHGNALPDIVRNSMPHEAIIGGEPAFKAALNRASSAYKNDVVNLWQLPASLRSTPGDSLSSIASRVVSERAMLTGEALSEKLLATELASLERLNPVIKHAGVLDGATVVTYDVTRLTQLSADLKVRHVPQLGEFLGIPKAQQDACLVIQMQDRSVRLGRIFVDQNLATAEAVESAFLRQKEWGEALSRVQAITCAEQASIFTSLSKPAIVNIRK